MDMSPNGIRLGAVELRGWQVHKLDPVPDDVSGQWSAYLVRVNYDFAVADDIPAPQWAEVRFEFPPGTFVADALPRSVEETTSAAAYTLTSQLNFVRREAGPGRWRPGSAADTIPMPVFLSRVECTGVGGDFVRWRHVGALTGGTHTAGLVLLVPHGVEALAVVASGTYHLETPPELKLRPVGRRDSFTVALPTATRAQQQPLAVVRERRERGAPRIFISYAHDNREHKAAVRQFHDFLTDWGADVHYDQNGLDSQRNWDKWIVTGILRSDFVLPIASPAYLAASQDELPPGQHKAAEFEYLRLADLLHRERETWTKKILPVILPGRSADEIPLSFLPGIVTHHTVTSYSAEGARTLIAVLGGGRAAG
ncbi:hypothetical protein [Alloactinosynnema sp. L-07]|nr:hypothetical protein [Alloactinosynnema sp. L-07]